MPWKGRIKYTPIAGSPKRESVMENPRTREIIDFIGEGKTFGEIFDNFKPDESTLPERYDQRGKEILRIQRELFSKLDTLVRLGVLRKAKTGLEEGELAGFLRDYLESEYVLSDLSKGMGRKGVPKGRSIEGMGFSGAALDVLTYKNPFAFEFLEPHSEKVQEMLKNYQDELVNGLREEGVKKSELKKTASRLLRKGFTLNKLKKFADTHGIGLGTAVSVAQRKDPDGVMRKAREIVAEHGIGLGTAVGVAQRKDPDGFIREAKRLVAEHGIGLGTAVSVAQSRNSDGVMRKAREIVAEHGIGLGTAVGVARSRDSDGVMRKAREIVAEHGIGLGTAASVAQSRDPDGVMREANRLVEEHGLELGTAASVAQSRDPDGVMREANRLVEAYGLGLGTVVRIAMRSNPDGVMRKAREIVAEHGIGLGIAAIVAQSRDPDEVMRKAIQLVDEQDISLSTAIFKVIQKTEE